MDLNDSVSDHNKEKNHLSSSLTDLLYSVTDVIHVYSINTIPILGNNTRNTK